MSCCCLPPDRVKLIVNSRVKMDCCCLPPDCQINSEQQERNKQQVQNGPTVKMGFCYLPPGRVIIGLLLFTPWQSQTNSEQQGQNGLLLFTPWLSQTNSKQQKRNKQQGQNGQTVKMGFCYLPPDRVKLAVNSKKETNSRVKVGKESRLLLFTPWKSQTNSEQQVRNKQQGQNGPRVKMGFCYLPPERVKMGAAAVYPLTESNK